MKAKFSCLWKKYNSMPIAVKAGVWFTVCSFLQRGFTMITTPIFTRVLSEEQYGVVSTFGAWQTLLLMLTTLSLYKALMNLYVQEENKEKVLSAVSGLSLVITSFWLLVYLIFYNQIAHLLGMTVPLTFCLFASFVFQAAIDNWMLHRRYLYDYKKIVIVTLTITIFACICSVIGVLFVSKTAEGRLVPQTIVTVVIGIFVYISIFKENHTFFDKKIWKFSVNFCVALLPHYLSEFVLQGSDKIMISYMCGTKEVALYSIAYAAGSLINLVTNAINATFAPYQYQQIKEKNYDELAKRANQVLIGVALILSVIMLFSNEIVLVFGGRKYLECTQIIIPICVGVFYSYIFQLFARVQEYYERKMTVVLPSIFCAILNLFLNYIFIKIYGYKAASYTTVFCYALFSVLHYFFYKKVCKEELGGKEIYNVKGIVIIACSILVVGIFVLILGTVMWAKYCVIISLIITSVIFRRNMIHLFKAIIGK